MIELAEGVFLLPGKPLYGINIYVIDGMLVDAGTSMSHRRIFRELGDTVPESHLITHAHPDHFGSSAAVQKKFGIPVLCGEVDAGDVEQGTPQAADTFLARTFLARMPTPPGCPVDRRLKEGDRLGRFEVIDVPGHSPGHIALWCAADGLLVLGDVLFNLKLPTMRHGLTEPPRTLDFDPVQNRNSARKVAPLEPKLVLFGHGPPLRDTETLTSFIAGLPA